MKKETVEQFIGRLQLYTNPVIGQKGTWKQLMDQVSALIVDEAFKFGLKFSHSYLSPDYYTPAITIKLDIKYDKRKKYPLTGVLQGVEFTPTGVDTNKTIWGITVKELFLMTLVAAGSKNIGRINQEIETARREVARLEEAKAELLEEVKRNAALLNEEYNNTYSS